MLITTKPVALSLPMLLVHFKLSHLTLPILIWTHRSRSGTECAPTQPNKPLTLPRLLTRLHLPSSLQPIQTISTVSLTIIRLGHPMLKKAIIPPLRLIPMTPSHPHSLPLRAPFRPQTTSLRASRSLMPTRRITLLLLHSPTSRRCRVAQMRAAMEAWANEASLLPHRGERLSGLSHAPCI